MAVNERGAITFSDNVPTEMRDHVLGMLQRFDMDKDAQAESYGIGKTAKKLGGVEISVNGGKSVKVG